MPNNLNKSEYIQEIVHLKPEAASKSNLFFRFIDTIKNTFFQATKTVLSGKAKDHQKQTHKVLKHLLRIKKELKEKINTELFKHVEKAIDPIARDAERLQKIMNQENSTHDKNKTEIKYRQWIEKAERWVGLDNKLDLQVSVVEAIINHHFSEVEEQIDHDLQLIEDYERHSLSNLALSSEKMDQLTNIIKQNLSVHVNELIKLKEKPEQVTHDLHKVKQWKSELTLQRSLHFEKALHKIDALIEQMSPTLKPEEKSNSEFEMLEREADILESETVKILLEEANQSPVDSGKKISLRLRFQWLQQKAHSQHLDHQASSHQAEQLNKISSAIERINKEIAQFTEN